MCFVASDGKERVKEREREPDVREKKRKEGVLKQKGEIRRNKIDF